MFNKAYLNSSSDVFNDKTSSHILRLKKKSKFQHLTRKLKEILSPFSLWRRSLKSIEKNCGCGVVSYFRFIAWLLKLNLIMLLVLFSILIIPYLVIKPYKFEDLTDTDQLGNTSNKFSKAINCSKNALMKDDSNYFNIFLNILQGKGPLEQSPMFMGYYFNKSYFNISSDIFIRTAFNTPIAYGISFGLCMFISLIATLYSSGQNYKSYLVDETEFNKSFSLSIFGGYDFGITKEKRIIHSRSILSKKLKIEYQQRQENAKRLLLSMNNLVLIYFIRFAINFLYVGFLIFVYGVIAYAQNTSIKLLQYDSVRKDQILSLLVDYIPAVVISAINILFPIVNNKVVLLEKYRSTFAMGVCLKRVILVQATALLVFMITLLDQINESNGADSICQQTDKIKCWETFVGQQFYRLSILGFFSSIIVGPILQFARAQLFLRKVFGGLLGPLIFDLPTEGFLLIRTQTECWMGLWFCPFLPIIMTTKLILLFYIRKLMFMRNLFVPSMETLSVAGGQRFFQDMLSYSLAFVMLPVGYLLSKKTPSRGCSPFRIYDDTNAGVSFSSSLRDYIVSLSSGMKVFWDIIQTMYTTIAIILVLVIIIYVKYAQSKTQTKYQSILREQISMAQKDKRFYDEKILKMNNILKKRNALLNHNKDK